MPILPKIQLVHTCGPCLPVPDKDVETGTLTDNMGYHAKHGTLMQAYASLKRFHFRTFRSDSSIFGCGHINLWKYVETLQWILMVRSSSFKKFFRVLSGSFKVSTVSTLVSSGFFRFGSQFPSLVSHRLFWTPFMGPGPCYS